MPELVQGQQNNIDKTAQSGADPATSCHEGTECLSDKDSDYPCMCVCREGICIFRLQETVEKMNNIIKPKPIGVQHTNFPVSLSAIESFKNPLGRVAFNIAGSNPKPIIKIVPDMFKGELNPEPLKQGWQQPIVSWTRMVDPRIQPGDVYSDAKVEVPYSPIPVFETPLIFAKGQDQRIVDKFTKSKAKKASFPKGNAKTFNGNESTVNMPPRGEFKKQDPMNLPESAIALNKTLKQKIERTPEQLKEDEKRRLAAVAKQFNAASKLTEKAQKELNAIRDEHNQQTDDFNLNESSINQEAESNSKVGNTVSQLENQLKDMTISLQKLRGDSSSKQKLNFKNHLQEVQNNLKQVQSAIETLDTATKNSLQDANTPIWAGSMPGPIAHNEVEDMRLNDEGETNNNTNIETNSLMEESSLV